MKIKLICFLLMIPLLALSQERKTLTGRVLADGIGIGDVFIINKATGIEKKSDAQGNFVIEARAGDAITAYSTKTVVRDFAITEASFQEQPYIISVNVQAYELDEVIIENRITSESLGLVPKDQKQYTHAEKKLFAATSGFGIDGLINAINGKTKMLKRAVETEKKEMLLDKINYVATKEELMIEYKIPEEYINGFVFYLVEDAEFAKAINTGNDKLARFLMTGLSVKYLKLIGNEK